jgi:hypothetical protein
MTIRVVNVTLGTKGPSTAVIPTTAIPAAAVSGHVSISYDDTVVTTKDHLIQGVRAALASALGTASLTN